MSIFGDAYYSVRNSQFFTRILDSDEVEKRGRENVIYKEERDGRTILVEISHDEQEKAYAEIEKRLSDERKKALEHGVEIDKDTYEATLEMLKARHDEELVNQRVAIKERQFRYAEYDAERYIVDIEYPRDDDSINYRKESGNYTHEADKRNLRKLEKERNILKNAARDFGGGVKKIEHQEHDTFKVGNQEWVKLRESVNHKKTGISKGKDAEEERMHESREHVRMMPREEEKTEKALSIKKQMESARNEQAKEKATKQREAGKKKLMSEYKNPDGKDAVRNQAKTQSKESSFQNFFNSFRERCKQTRFYQKVIEKTQEKEAERVR